MTERPRFLDDLAGVAGGAISALAGLREEAEALVRARVDETIRRLDLIRREELDAVQDLAANARAGQEAAESALAGLLLRVESLETRLSHLESEENARASEPAGAPDVSGNLGRSGDPDNSGPPDSSRD